MSDLAVQAAHAPTGTDLVTIQTGTTDACGSPPTRPAAFRKQFEAALDVLDARVPRARIVVLGIFTFPARARAAPPASNKRRGFVGGRSGGRDHEQRPLSSATWPGAL
jgi:hypothetical protein